MTENENPSQDGDQQQVAPESPTDSYIPLPLDHETAGLITDRPIERSERERK